MAAEDSQRDSIALVAPHPVVFGNTQRAIIVAGLDTMPRRQHAMDVCPEIEI